MGGPRRRVVKIVNPWRVEWDGFGQMVVRDEEGNDPFDHPDPYTTALNKYLAAAAPGMKQALQAARARHSVIGSPFWRDDEIDHLMQCALSEAIMPHGEIVRVCKSLIQVEMKLEAA